jgi:hypothetical protein
MSKQDTPAPAPKSRRRRGSLSVSDAFFKRLDEWCTANHVPLSAVVEINAARAIGMPLSELPKRIQKWVDKVPEFAIAPQR